MLCLWLAAWLVLISHSPENGRFVWFADVAPGNSFIDGTNDFVHAFVICCAPVTTFSVSDLMFCTAFDTEFLAVGCLVLTSFGALLVVSCRVDVAHAFVTGMLPCLIVGLFVAGVHEVFTLFMASRFVGQSRLVVECPCPPMTHFSVRVLLSLHWVDACLPAQYLQV